MNPILKTSKQISLANPPSLTSSTDVEHYVEEISKRKLMMDDDDYMVNPKPNNQGSRKRKQKLEDKQLSILEKTQSDEASITKDVGPPKKAKTAGKDLDIVEVFSNRKYLSNIDIAAVQFEQKGKIHRLVDLSGKALSVLMLGTISTAFLGKYGTFNMEYERSLEKARLSFHLQAMPGWEAEHDSLIKKMNELEQKQFGVGKTFTAEDKQLAVKPGDRILLKRKIWKISDSISNANSIVDDPDITLWSDMLAAKKEPNYFPLGAYDFNGKNSCCSTF
jgi:hypothetical protein